MKPVERGYHFVIFVFKKDHQTLSTSRALGNTWTSHLHEINFNAFGCPFASKSIAFPTLDKLDEVDNDRKLQAVEISAQLKLVKTLEDYCSCVKASN